VAHDRIPIAAFHADLPTDPKYTDALVELVAWFWTEGHIRQSGAVKITQAHKNAANVDRIDACLRAVYGPPSDKLPHSRWGAVPVWTRRPELRPAGGVNRVAVTLERFHLNASAAEALVFVAPDRVVRHSFLRSLTQAQLELFIMISMLAENCGPTRLAQKNKVAAESFQFACILAGWATSLLHRPKPDNRAGMWGVTIRRQRYLCPVVSHRQSGPFRIEEVEHDGIVWCPVTPNQTWMARRRGTCYFTGNTHTLTGPTSDVSWWTAFGRTNTEYLNVADCKIDSVKIDFDMALVKVTVVIKGCTLTLGAAAWTPTYTDDEVTPGALYSTGQAAAAFTLDGVNMRVAKGSIEINNNLTPIVPAYKVTPDDFGVGEQMGKVQFTIIPDDLAWFKKSITGTGTGTAPASVPYYAPWSVKFLENVTSATHDLTITGARSNLRVAFPPGDPKGGAMEVVVDGSILDPRTGSAAITAVLRNGLATIT